MNHLLRYTTLIMFEELKKFESRNKNPDYIYKMNIFVTLMICSGLIA